MLPAPSLKDLESLTKLFGKFVPAFFAFASVIDPPFQFDLLVWIGHWLAERGMSPLFLMFGTLFLWATFWFGALAIITELLAALGWGFCVLEFRIREALEITIETKTLVELGYWYVIGCSFMGFGLLAAAKFGGSDPFPHINLYWEIALFTYGVGLIYPKEQ